MADTKISGLPAVGTPADTDELGVNQGGSSKKVTLNQLTAYFEQRGRQNNASVATQNMSATDTILTGSHVPIPNGRLQAKTRYRMRCYLAKTSVAGTGSVVLNVRIGTAGTTSDTSRAALTFAVQTAVADEGTIDLDVTFRTVGSGTSAVLQSGAILDHRLAATGLTTVNSSVQVATSGGFDSTVSNLIIGCSIATGASTTGTISQVTAELFNLA